MSNWKDGKLKSSGKVTYIDKRKEPVDTEKYNKNFDSIFNQPKLWEINDVDWVIARNYFEAKKFYRQQTGTSDDEIEIVKVEDDRLDRLTYLDEDCKEKTTFREEMERWIKDGENIPGFFASSEY